MPSSQQIQHHHRHGAPVQLAEGYSSCVLALSLTEGLPIFCWAWQGHLALLQKPLLLGAGRLGAWDWGTGCRTADNGQSHAGLYAQSDTCRNAVQEPSSRRVQPALKSAKHSVRSGQVRSVTETAEASPGVAPLCGAACQCIWFDLGAAEKQAWPVPLYKRRDQQRGPPKARTSGVQAHTFISRRPTSTIACGRRCCWKRRSSAAPEGPCDHRESV